MTKQDLQRLFPGSALAVGTPSDVADCLALRAATTLELERLGTPELCLAQESPTEFGKFFDDADSRALVLRSASRELIGFGIATYTGESLQHFRPLIADFDAAPRRVGYIKLIQVASSFRGHRLQQIFFAELESWLQACGSSYACGTVSPNNIASLRNFINCGYREAERFTHASSGYARLRMIKRLDLEP